MPAQVGFKRELIKEVRLFVLDAQEFRQDWEANGPMVPGLDPMDAVDRLKKFQLMFEVGLFCCTALMHCKTHPARCTPGFACCVELSSASIHALWAAMYHQLALHTIPL